MTAILTLTVEGKEFGRKRPTTSNTIPYPPYLTNRGGRTTLRDLITRIVMEEVESFHQRQRDRSLFRVLSPEQISDGVSKGKIDAAPHEAQSVNEQQAITTALQAFEDGLFFTFIDREQKEDLDEEVAVNPDSTITFLRLMPLAGG